MGFVDGFYFILFFDEWVLILLMFDEWVLLMVDGFVPLWWLWLLGLWWWISL